MSAEARGADSPAEGLQERARGQLAMLLAQFLVGLAVSRIGMPSETNGFPRVASIVLLALHLLISVGLVVGAILTLVLVARTGARGKGLAWGGAASIALAIVAGAMTYITRSDWWSYLMGAGATLSLPLYGLLYLRSTESETARMTG